MKIHILTDKKSLLLLFALLLNVFLFSQKRKEQKPELKLTAQLIQVGEIKENNNLRGYYEYLKIDKSFGKEQNYLIDLFDENLNKLNEIKFKDGINLQLLNCAYSNEELCFMFVDNENKKFVYKIFDVEGKLLNEVKSAITKKQFRKLKKFGTSSQLINLEGGGFLSTSTVVEKGKLTFKLTKFPHGSKDILSYQFPLDKKFNTPYILGLSNGLIVLSVTSSKSIYGSASYWLLGIDALTMKQKMSKYSEIDGEYVFKPYSLVENPDYNTIKVSGTYFSVNDNTTKASKGLAMWELDTSGALLREKYNSWVKNFGSYLNFNEMGKSREVGYIKVHETFSTIDGKIYAIGEGYRKKFNPFGLITLIFSYPCMLSKFQTTDLALFSFDNNFKFISGKNLPKRKESLTGYGFSTQSPHVLSNFLPLFGYRYVQLNEDRNAFMIAYTEDNFKQFRGKRNKFALNTYKFQDGKYSFDKFNSKKDKKKETSVGNAMYFRNQFGKIVQYGFNKNDKESKFRIIKVK